MSNQDKRVVFDFEVDFTNGGGIQGQSFRLDLAERSLECGGQFVRLPPKALETLAVLVRAHPGVVSREELHARLWPEAVVEDSNLTQHIYVLRKTLGVAPDGRHYIETVARRGYRFVGNVTVVTAAPPVEAEVPVPQPFLAPDVPAPAPKRNCEAAGTPATARRTTCRRAGRSGPGWRVRAPGRRRALRRRRATAAASRTAR